MSGLKAWPACDGARGLDGEQFPREIAHGAFGVFLGLLPAPAAEGVEGRAHLARAHVFADEMRLADGDVEFRRGLVGFARRVFDDQAFLLRVGRGCGLLQLLARRWTSGIICKPR